MEEDIVKSKLKCPKCKSVDLNICEVWKGHSIVWEQRDSKFDRNDGTLETGDPISVYAECKKCNHGWKVKGALQISDIIDH